MLHYMSLALGSATVDPGPISVGRFIGKFQEGMMEEAVVWRWNACNNLHILSRDEMCWKASWHPTMHSFVCMFLAFEWHHTLHWWSCRWGGTTSGLCIAALSLFFFFTLPTSSSLQTYVVLSYLLLSRCSRETALVADKCNMGRWEEWLMSELFRGSLFACSEVSRFSSLITSQN